MNVKMENRPSGCCRRSWIKNRIGPNYVSAALLTLANLVGYMDLYTISAVFQDIAKEFNLDESEKLGKIGLLQTVKYLSIGISAPLWGDLGDRMSRKCIIIICVVLWSIMALLSSFANSYEMIVAFQALLGIWHSGFAINAPSVIKDLFDHLEAEKYTCLFGKYTIKTTTLVSLWLAIFTYPKPIGVGLAYILASSVNKMAINESQIGWRLAIRSTIFFSMPFAIVLLVFLKDPYLDLMFLTLINE